MAKTTPANPNASIEGQALQTLLNVLTSSQSPDMQQAQAFLLRRLALEKGILKDISLNIQPAANTTEMTVDNRELQQILQTAIQQLPPQQKNCPQAGEPSFLQAASTPQVWSWACRWQ